MINSRIDVEENHIRHGLAQEFGRSDDAARGAHYRYFGAVFGEVILKHLYGLGHVFDDESGHFLC